MTEIRTKIAGSDISVRVDRTAPLGSRFRSLAGFPKDPVDPRPYGGSRCPPLAMIDIEGNSRWLCAMELDHSFRLFCSHDLFPCASQNGADHFAHEIIERYARQPSLL